MASSSGRTYAEALTLLDSLQSNRTVVSSISNSSRDMNQDAIPEMLEWTRKAGYEASDFANGGLRCLHVAGSKGKGSVCAMVENILLQYRSEAPGLVRKQIEKVGTYTSPHLITVRERIRIDGHPISESLFTQYFFELWDRFSDVAAANSTPNPQSADTKPGYFRYLTIMAFHAFIQEGVESAIVECGIGGEYDSTNILPPEAVTVSGITLLGSDHIGMLGQTVTEIAWHKAGIMKLGVPAFTVEQRPECQTILANRALEKDVDLKVVKCNPSLKNEDVKIGLEGDFQKDNASLAIAIADTHLQALGVDVSPDAEHSSSTGIPDKFLQALATVKLPGRCEVREDGNIQWLIDGAHTIDSIEATSQWFVTKVQESRESTRPLTAAMLIFNQQDRDPTALIRALVYKASDQLLRYPDVKLFTYAAFCTNTPFKSDFKEGTTVDLTVQKKTASFYEVVDSNKLHECYATVEEAVQLARKVAEAPDERVLVLVTGSLHLAGGVLRVLNRDQKAMEG